MQEEGRSEPAPQNSPVRQRRRDRLAGIAPPTETPASFADAAEPVKEVRRSLRSARQMEAPPPAPSVVQPTEQEPNYDFLKFSVRDEAVRPALKPVGFSEVGRTPPAFQYSEQYTPIPPSMPYTAQSPSPGFAASFSSACGSAYTPSASLPLHENSGFDVPAGEPWKLVPISYVPDEWQIGLPSEFAPAASSAAEVGGGEAFSEPVAASHSRGDTQPTTIYHKPGFAKDQKMMQPPFDVQNYQANVPSYPIEAQSYSINTQSYQSTAPSYPAGMASYPGEGSAQVPIPMPEAEFVYPAAPSEALPLQETMPKQMPLPQKSLDAPRSPFLLGRMVVMAALALGLLFCVIEIGKIVTSLMQNEQEIKKTQEEYLRGGGTLPGAGARVDLLPEGQTFAPTTTPQPTVTPAGMQAAASAEDKGDDMPLPQAGFRTKRTRYENNTMFNILEPFAELYVQNNDIAGRLVFEGMVDELVMQRNNTYYLNHNADGSSSSSGAVFLDEAYRLQPPPENLLLRGRSTFAGELLAPLLRFQTDGIGFVQQNAIFRFDSLYEQNEYVIFAVIAASNIPGTPEYFPYGAYVAFTDDEQMLSFVASAKGRSLYDIPVDVQAADQLATICLLNDGADGITTVLMARRLRTDETAASFGSVMQAIREH